MLLCVAGGSGAEFRRDRPQAGSRCSSQSFLIKSNANQQVMVEERCSMTSSAASNDHVAARATLSLHLKSNKVPHSCSKESSVAYKSRVIVVSGEGAALGSCSDKGETCSTTTTFKSNVVNGKRGTNTILVRYKPSKPVSEDSDDELQFEFSSKARSSSPSSESSSIKKSISAWAQIMELEGYRSPAVGLDNGPSKRVSSESDSISNFSSLSAESYRSEPSESSYERQTGDEGRFRKHNIISIASKCAPSTVNDSAESCADSSKNRYMKNISLNPDGSNQLHILSMRSKGFVPNRYSDTVSNSVSSNDISGMPQTLSKMPPKCKSSMYRSESSRVTKIPSQEKHKYRRKTLPDGTLSLNASAAPLNKPASVAKNQKSPEHDPNASWGRYNSRAMRDSVRKVAEKYAETVYLRRQTRSQLDSLPESKRVPMTGCIVHSNDHDHPHVSKRELLSENHLYLSKRANSTSHLHEIPSEKESSSRNRLHFVMPASLRHDHSSMHAINNCLKAEVHYKPKYGEMNQDQEEEANFILSENSRLNSSIDEDSLNSVDVSKLLSLDFNYENAQSSYFEKDANEIFDGEFGNNNNLQEDRCRGVLPRTKKYQTSNPLKSSQSISSIECRISSAETKPFQVSFRMQDVKSKLCADCAQSAELGPPNKQSACRARHHLSDACSHKDVMISQISLLKRAPLVIDEGDSSPPLYLRPANSKFNSGTRKCTMLTAREMEELVHGKESADTKLNQTSVTSKVSNWIQKQKDKRKPVFFIGDAPAFYNEKVNESNLGTNSKYSSHKSRRSLSLSSVREGETSISISDRPDNTSDLSSFANGEEMLLKPNEHKGLFIKRTSSSCSNRGSIRRKGRQGSPAREEKETIKNHHCQHNQVDESITSWGNRIHRKPKNCCHKELITTNDLSYRNNTESLVQSEGNHNDSETSQQKCSTFRKNIQQSNSSPKASGKKCFYSSEALNLHVANNSLIYGDPSLLGGQGSRHSYSVISTPNSDLSELARPERSSTAKKLLNFKQITRALSLHSLKKKTREVPMCSNVAAQVPVISLSKWSRGSKRKIENMKYGSLRKSISYCELTARGAKVSGKLDFPIKSLNKTKAPVQKPPTKPPSCACASSLRRSVSLYWQFPLQKTQEYAIENPKSDLLAKICFSRLHRRNTLLPFLREVKNKKSETNEVSKHHYLNGETRNTLLDYKQQSTSRPLILDGKQDLRTPPDTANSDDQQKNLTSLDQIWRANPVKLCRVHSRLLMCRHKGRYRLRRSISQPVELEMSGSVHNLRESTHGSADHDSFQKGSLSSEDEASSESDIYHSYCCSPTRRSNTCWELSADGTMYAEALWDHETLDSEELPFQAGDIIEVTDTSDQDWWWGTKDGQGGWFPSAFVRLYVSHRGPSLHFNGQQSDGIQIPYSPCKVSMNNLSCEQVRANIVQEIVATERDYVKHLKDVVEGYLKQVHRRPDMFSKERIETVFGNIKEIYTFQSQFLKELEDCLDKESPHLSQIGNCFLNHKEEFKIYSQYCNNHPLAVSELQELYCDSQYIHFFEACRLLQEMIDISLDGFLLTPIQRICKYPLQLAELLKFTDENHPDHVPVSNALSAMKEVAELVNERKRRMECLERLAEWQSTIEGWEGPDVLDTSSVLIHCGEVTRVSSSWSRDIYLFLFDHQLIYCKKDLLKRHTYAYKGRLNLDHCDIVDVEDGKDSQFAVNVKNAWKIYCKDKEKWYLFYAKTFPEKEQWLRAFKAERQRVNDDEKQAFVVTEEAKRSARLAVHNKHKPKRPRAKFTKGRRCHPDVAVTELLLDSPNAKSRSGSLPSNIHPELAIMAGAKLGPTRKKGSGWFHFGSGKKPKS